MWVQAKQLKYTSCSNLGLTLSVSNSSGWIPSVIRTEGFWVWFTPVYTRGVLDHELKEVFIWTWFFSSVSWTLGVGCCLCITAVKILQYIRVFCMWKSTCGPEVILLYNWCDFTVAFKPWCYISLTCRIELFNLIIVSRQLVFAWNYLSIKSVFRTN